MQACLLQNQVALRDRTYNLFAQNANYKRFSHDINDSIETGPDGLDSVESIHGQIHLLAGGRGHCGEVDYAAFDPIFWLHHANVSIPTVLQLEFMTEIGGRWIEYLQCGKVCCLIDLVLPKNNFAYDMKWSIPMSLSLQYHPSEPTVL